jgi:glycosyltransferase involved in cell wall biosynthesis
VKTKHITIEYDNDVQNRVQLVLKKNRVAIFIVAYNAEKKINSVLERIPEWILKNLHEIYVIDDSSIDATFEALTNVRLPEHAPPFHIFRTPYNLGYGGNQKMGYCYALENKIDIVVLLHGDGQYAPESLPMILEQYADFEDSPDAVFGTRFSKKGHPIKGGMPLYKWIGNKVLTTAQNILAGTSMSEMHSGYRSYRSECLSKIPFSMNSNDFHFDAEIILQHIIAGFKIKEVDIPTYYGDEICHVNGIKYAWNCIKTFIKFRLMKEEIFYDPKFDIRIESGSYYKPKEAPSSLHSYIRNINLGENKRVADIGGGNGDAVAKYFAEKHQVFCIDSVADDSKVNDGITRINQDLNNDWSFNEKQFDVVFALDVLEHLHSPEDGAAKLFKIMKSGGTLYASTGNIAYFILRIMLLLGKFNYGRRGILDLTHTRLMTINSFRRLLTNAGFTVTKKVGFSPPLKDLHPNSWVYSCIDKISTILAKIWPSMFAFSILLICKRPDSIQDLTEKTFQRSLQ